MKKCKQYFTKSMMFLFIFIFSLYGNYMHVSADEELDYILDREMTQEEIEQQKSKVPELREIPTENFEFEPVQSKARTVLPSYYDARQEGVISPVKDQGIWGDCWSFAAMAGAEASIIKKGVASAADFSELHFAYFFYNRVNDPLDNTAGDRNQGTMGYLDNGGNSMQAAIALAGWTGAADENIAPYLPYEEPSVPSDELAYQNSAILQNARFLSSDRNEMKEAIMNYGSVAIMYYHNDDYMNYNTAAYSYPKSGTNHVVSVVGWDDNYSKNNFQSESGVQENGAWIVKNSWGEEWGDQGYFYLSYEDQSVTARCSYEFQSASAYDNNYQYDGNAVPAYNSINDGGSIANVYEVKANQDGRTEILKAVEFALFSSNVDYSIQIYVNPTDIAVPTSGIPALENPITGRTENAGIYTVDLEQQIYLSQGDNYAIVITFSGKSVINYAIERDADYEWISFQAETNPNQSFCCVTNEAEWKDLYQYSSCARVKGFTVNDSNDVLTGSCGEDATWILTGNGLDDEGKQLYCLKISGVGSVTDMSQLKEYRFQINKVVIEEGITAIDWGYIWSRFEGESQVKSISFPSTLTYIGTRSFGDCSRLENVNFPENLLTIGEGAFSLCEGIKEISYNNKLEEIGANAFLGCVNLKTVSFPESLRIIGSRAFFSCDKLATILFNQGIEQIGYEAFAGCGFEGEGLKTVTIPDSIQYIESGAFKWCNTLESVFINGAPQIGGGVFAGCSKLETVDLGNCVRYRDHNYQNEIFAECVNLKEVVISDNFDLAFGREFSDSPNVKVVIPENSQKYAEKENNIIFSKDNKILYYYPAHIQERYFFIPEGTEVIGQGAFSDNPYIEYVDMPYTIKEINVAFQCCTALKCVIIPDGVTEIKANTFYACDNIEQFVLPGSIEQLYWDVKNTASSFPEDQISNIQFYGDIGTYAEDFIHSLGKDFTQRSILTFTTDGKLSFQSKSILEGVPYGILPSAEKEGASFEGWYTAKDGGTQIEKGTIVTNGQNHVVYAHWTYEPEIKLDAVTGLEAIAAGKNKVALSWSAVEKAEGYLIYAQKSGKYGYVGMTTRGTTYTDTKALDSDYNYYWVFPYIKDNSGKMIPGGCTKYVFAKGICPAVTNLKASSVKGGVKLTWKAAPDAEGYLIYGQVAGNKYGYVGMTTKGTTFTDAKASKIVYNYYWVYPYHKDASGKMIVGGTPKYTYGKAL